MIDIKERLSSTEFQAVGYLSLTLSGTTHVSNYPDFGRVAYRLKKNTIKVPAFFIPKLAMVQ